MTMLFDDGYPSLTSNILVDRNVVLYHSRTRSTNVCGDRQFERQTSGRDRS